MASTVKRQLKKSLGLDASLLEIEHLLTLVNEAYTSFDDDKELLEHSLELTLWNLLIVSTKLTRE